jgi:hypothetical protein
VSEPQGVPDTSSRDKNGDNSGCDQLRLERSHPAAPQVRDEVFDTGRALFAIQGKRLLQASPLLAAGKMGRLPPLPLFLGGTLLCFGLLLLPPLPLFLDGTPLCFGLLLLPPLPLFLDGLRHFDGGTNSLQKFLEPPLISVALPANQVGGLDGTEPEGGEDIIQMGGHQDSPISTHGRLISDPRREYRLE